VRSDHAVDRHTLLGAGLVLLMAAVRYRGHLARTRQQAVWQNLLIAFVLLPLAIWRASTQPFGVAVGLVLLATAPFVIAYQAWRFLAFEERVHQEATPEMLFVFRFLANTPLTFGALTFVILLGIA
jgi:hypothetical protein